MKYSCIFPFLVSILDLIFCPPVSAENICQKYNMKHGLFSMKADGTDLTLLRETPGPAALTDLHVSPDGKQIVFSRCTQDRDNNCKCDYEDYFTREIVVSDLDGSNEVIAGVNEGGFNHYPNWAPDGRSVIFVHSKGSDKLDAGIYQYNMETKTTSKLIDQPGELESDNYWNQDGSITFISQPVRDGEVINPNNVFRFYPDTLKIEKLTNFSIDFGKHCCAADPKYSPDMKTLVHSEFRNISEVEGKKIDNWDIVLKSGDVVTYLGREDAEDYWPMWNDDSSKLLWISWSPINETQSLLFREISFSKDVQIDLVGENAEFPTGNGGVVFGYVPWADWFHTKKDTVIFPATFASW